ncbi:hypothetical protein MNBD_GAMMA13-316 [hydrothermal vent metagenome]|uniref:Uncharacterized protein n=1 Tax=hydrothermal vent metagenome TaxID=652676 RepID=A0A3B0YBA5_9ZZZZ
MNTISKKLAGYLMASVLTVTMTAMPMVAGASSFGYMGQDAKPTGGAMMADAFLIRPFMLASTVVTTVTFVLALPFSAAGGNVGDSADRLVVGPAAYTFARPLGKL